MKRNPLFFVVQGLLMTLLVMILPGVKLVSAQNTGTGSLLNPANQDTIFNQNPVFTWWSIGSSNQNYVFKLVEKQNFQSATAAILSNPIYYIKSGITTTAYIYPLAAPNLLKGHTYVWQITSEISGQEGGWASEPWEFTVGQLNTLQEDKPDTLIFRYKVLVFQNTNEKQAIPVTQPATQTPKAFQNNHIVSFLTAAAKPKQSGQTQNQPILTQTSNSDLKNSNSYYLDRSELPKYHEIQVVYKGETIISITEEKLPTP